MTTPDLSKRGKWGALTVALLFFGIILAAGFIYFYDKKEDESPKVLTTEQVKDPDAVAKEVRVSQPAAQTIVREIERASGEAPSITYYVQSPNLDRATETTETMIRKNDKSLPKAVTAKSDRTVVTPDTTAQKVDVYKINLNKAHKIKTGILFIDGKAYPSVGYQAGRWEGALHLDGQAVKGGTIMYTAIQW